jgi:hypothetical protein
MRGSLPRTACWGALALGRLDEPSRPNRGVLQGPAATALQSRSRAPGVPTGRLHAQLREDAEDRYLSPIRAAICRGWKRTPRPALERAYAIRDRGMVWIKVAPRLDPLRQDPRFGELLRRMNLAG